MNSKTKEPWIPLRYSRLFFNQPYETFDVFTFPTLSFNALSSSL